METSISFKPWIPTQLLVPWSSRLSFSSSVCGLPGRDHGCWRYEEFRRANQLQFDSLRDAAVRPSSAPTNALLWLVFEIDAKGDGELCRTVCRGKAEVDRHRGRSGRHSIVLGFGAPLEQAQPISLECRAWTGKRHEEIVAWARESLSAALQSSAPLPTLYDCFANRLFEPQPLDEIAYELRLSIAELLARYLDGRCHCFRHHDLGAHFGVSWCHLEVFLRCRVQEEQEEQSFGVEALAPGERNQERFPLAHYGVSFSFVDPETRELSHLEELHFGGLEFAQEPEEQLSRYMRHRRPLIVGARSRDSHEAALTYADCLASEHREQILPSELDRSYLWFTCEEISAYLLFWMLARILASQEPANADCKARLLELIETDDEAGDCAALLSAIVHLPWEEGVFHRELCEQLSPEQARFLGLFPQPISFRHILETVDLHHGGEALARLARFLLREFRADRPREESLGFRFLPMYAQLGWQASPAMEALVAGGEEPALDGEAGQRLLGLVIRSLGRQLPARHRQAPEALAALANRLSRDSVFPFAHVLTHWPPDRGVRRYFIFPIWESVIDGQSRPSIFAHVFSCRAAESRAEVEREGEFLHEQLLFFGRFIAQSYYDRKLQEIQTQRHIAAAAYNIGHPMKRRVDVLRAALNSLLDIDGKSKPVDPLEILEQAHLLGSLAARVSNLGHILDVLSDRLNGPTRRAILARKAEWHCFDKYDVAAGLDRSARQPTPPGLSRIELRRRRGLAADGQVIRCFIPGERGPFRPADIFYDEMLFEVFTNAGKHGASRHGIVEVTCSVEDLGAEASKRPALVFRNRCRRPPQGQDLKRRMGGWARWQVDGRSAVGGLFFLANLISEIELGTLWTSFERQADSWVFALALELAGLEKGNTP